MDSPVRTPRFCGFKFTLVAGLALLTTDALFAQSADQSDMDALKAQMNQMQKQYEQRIEAMEAQMKALEANQNSGSILNTRVLTDSNGKEVTAPSPMLDESFLKSLTRNFTFNIYLRAGFMFNGNGGAGTFNFEAPDNPGGRVRLGNENDFYTEVSLNQAHILGDSPDVADVSLRITPNFFTHGIYHESFLTTNNTGFQAAAGTSDFNVGMREAYAEMKNVFKSAPEITFWAGQRFYDRWNVDPNDWFWLDTSGFGIGAYNINIGPGNLYLAWIGANHDNLNLLATPDQENSVGDQFEQTFDVRYRNIDIGFGKLNLIAIGNYMKGGVVTPNGGQTFTNSITGATDTVNVSTSDAYGGGGGIIWEYDYGNKSYFRLAGLAGYGLTNFSAENLGNSIGAFEQGVNGFLIGKSEPNVHEVAPGVFNGSINPYRAAHEFRVIEEWVYNVNDCFSFDLWSYWDENNQGYTTVGANATSGTTGTFYTSGKTRDFVGVGLRPVYWITDNFAIQGSGAWQYVNNVRGYSGINAFGSHGNMGIFSIAPTIKPKGGYFTRPELRIFATYSIWQDSLRGSTTPIGEGGNTGPSSPPYNSLHTNQGWLLGSQMEIWF
jgi:maltoporin